MAGNNPYKARLHQVIDELPDDIGRILPDLITVLKWMGDPDRRYQQGGTGETLKPGDGPFNEHTIGVSPGIAAPFHHYILVFSPKPYK